LNFDQAQIAVQECSLLVVDVGNGGAQRVLGQSHRRSPACAAPRPAPAQGRASVGEQLDRAATDERGERPGVA